MATLKGKTLFFITSPRTPMKMLPEIDILVKNFTGKPWNERMQEAFMKKLAEDPRFEGSGSPKDLAFSARDRINRGPKALGFVNLKPTVALTEAGESFLDEDLAGEALLRQLLKFQLPSPYHTEPKKEPRVFFVRPYLEIFRLIHDLGHVGFDEVMMFGMQLTDYTKYDQIVKKINAFREAKNNYQGSYKQFRGQYLDGELRDIYAEEISEGRTRTRESEDASTLKFLKTKASNMRDYTDACFRYLRATGLVSISQKGKSLSILPEKMEEVEFFLKNEDRKPVFIDDEVSYKAYLFDNTRPVLYTDNRDNLEAAITKLGMPDIDFSVMSNGELKKVLIEYTRFNREQIIEEQKRRIKSFEEYDDVMGVFNDIKENNFYDTPLMLEWNTWRAMTMLDGGNIHANLKFDDSGQPLSTAAGNTADIVCDYDDFMLSVEVTMQSGQRQYEMEGEPVSRHLAKIKRDTDKDAYCFFIAPKINDSCIAHFYTLHLANIAFYGGKSIILPLELEVFEKMVEQSKDAGYVPEPGRIKALCNYSLEVAESASSEREWYDKIRDKALDWLAA